MKSTIDGIITAILIRISNLFTNKEIFDEHTPVYNNALKISSFKTKISYIPNTRLKSKITGLRPDDVTESQVKGNV